MSITFTLTGTSSILSTDYHPPIELPAEEQWYLGLIGFYTWNSIPNIENGVNNRFIYDDNIIEIPTGAYEITDIENYLNKNVHDVENRIVRKMNKPISIIANNNTLKCEITSVYDIDFTKPNTIASMLGFPSVLLKANQTHVSERPVSIIRVTNVRVNSNISTAAYHNSAASHTLFEFSPNVSPGYRLYVEPRNVIYLPINTRTINNITLQIVDQEGQIVNFLGETIVIRLELKKLT